MYVCGVDTKELVDKIDDRIDQGVSVDAMTLGTLLGLTIDQCYDSVVWKALGRLIWYMEHDSWVAEGAKAANDSLDAFQRLVCYMDKEQQAKEAESNPTCDVKEVEETEDHFVYDDVTYPIHYAGNNKITCKDALNSMMCPLETVITPKIGYWLGCAFKYLWRAFLKGDPKKDLKKCKQCIDEMLNLM